MKNDTEDPLSRILPSDFMRNLRPEYYSDTEDRAAYILDAATLEYHLESITSRNQTHNFEIFCRKLCERTICPNLRAHTGPDGGGDSKADTETYPVTKEIATLFYFGEEKTTHERWAFAFSSKETWASKVRSDVKGIVDTGRDYKRVICVTSRFAKDKERARVEDDLTKKYGIPVTIHDRSWIVKEIIENDRKDVAFNYLNVGEERSDPLRLGPTDYSRTQQLEEIEKFLADPDIFNGMEQQRVTEALLAAKLSRNLEQPRFETDGRFERAVRLAEADGTYLQELAAKYERIWTAFWWFDDFQYLRDSYESFETLVIKTNHAVNLELLSNLLQLLVNSVLHGYITTEESKIEERFNNLRVALEAIVQEKDLPNNALEAQTTLLIMRMNQAVLNENNDDLATVWSDFSIVLEKARSLGEFNAKRLIQMIEVAGDAVGNDPAYNTLVEKAAEFVSERTSEAEGALILLRRAQKLSFDDKFEMIRLLGKAAIGLTKKEYSEYLIEALLLLMLAYRSAGLLWASRATCISLAASLVIEGEQESQIPVSFVTVMKTLAWIALELRYFPDFLYAIQLLNGAANSLPLTEDSKAKVIEDLRSLDIALGSVLLNLDESNLHKFEDLPDILEALGLFMARMALLYSLGYIDVLRSEGLPDSETDEDVDQMFSRLASQPVSENMLNPFILNDDETQVRSTSILGLTVEVYGSGSTQSILVAEAVLGSVEVLFATAIELEIAPHTERLLLSIVEDSELSKPELEIDKLNMKGEIYWPADWAPSSFDKQPIIQRFLAEVSGHVLITCCFVQNFEGSVMRLFADDAFHNRMTMAALTATSYHRVASREISRLSDWQDAVQQSYTLRSSRPVVNTATPSSAEKGENVKSIRDWPSIPKDHRAYFVRSVIDVHSWDQARWLGTAFGQVSSCTPPFLAFVFDDKIAGKKIFARWCERFGAEDKNEEIYISIIRKLPDQNPHHYCILVTSNPSHGQKDQNNHVVTFATRSKVMEPSDDINLERFLDAYRHYKSSYIMPAYLGPSGMPEFFDDLAILKRKITVKMASEISEHDIEAVTIHTWNV